MKTWLSYASLSDGYERKARFAPALLTVVFLAPLSLAYSGPLGGWLNVLVIGVGTGAVVAIGLSHVASAAGNRFQRRLWPRWPFDSPTNRWLHPQDQSRSKQQRDQWYRQIRQVTDLDITAVDTTGDSGSEIERVINDAVSKVRYLLRNSEHGDRLRLHNADFGFARNLAGLSPVWLTCASLSCAGSWGAIWIVAGDVPTAVASTIVLVGAIILAVMLPSYVRVRADSYAESFFGALSLLADEPALETLPQDSP